MSSEEDYFEEEYIEEWNDPFDTQKIIEEDYTIPNVEKIVSFDEVFESVRCKITDLDNFDQMMEKKVLDALRSGNLK